MSVENQAPEFSQVVAHSGTDVIYRWQNTTANSLKFVRGFFVDSAGVTANDTNFITFSAELNSVEVMSEATTTTDLGNITADVPIALAQTSGSLLAPGELCELKLTEGGTGVAIAGVVTLQFAAVRT